MADDSNPRAVAAVRSSKRDSTMSHDDEDMEESKGYDDLLAKFYGVTMDASADVANGEAGTVDVNEQQDAAAQKEAAAAAEAKAERDARLSKTDLDSKEFQAGKYVEHILEKQGIQGLLQEEATIKSQVRNLESDMQMLVYENYNKFISATDMIRKMKTNVESMEQEMKRLTSKMSSISNKCEHLEGALETNRDKMENLVGVNRLLQRLQFLFELPHRLKKSIQMKAYSQAVRYYKVSHKILKRYKSIASFSKISSDSASIIEKLTKILKNLLQDPDENPLAKMENAGLLLSLHEPAENLFSALFLSMGQRLDAHLEEVVLAERELKNASSSSSSSSSVTSLPLFSMLEKGFIAAFSQFAEMFRDTFEEESANATQALASFTAKVFKRYFDTVSRLLDIQAHVRSESDAKSAAKQFTLALAVLTRQVSRPSSLVQEAKLFDKTAAVIELKIRLFKDGLMQHTHRRILKYLHSAFVVSVEMSKKKQLVPMPLSTDLEAFLKSHAERVSEQEEEEKEEKEAKEGDDQKNDADDSIDDNEDDEEEGEGEDEEAAAAAAAEEKRKRAISRDNEDDLRAVDSLDANIVAGKIRDLVEESLETLMPVLDVHEYLPTGLFIGLSFADLARGHMSHALHKILQTLQIGCGVSYGGAGKEHILQVPAASELSNEIPGIKGRAIPIFILYLSELCRRLYSEHIPKVWNTLQMMSKALKKHRQNLVNVYQRELPTILSKYKAASRTLLNEYAKVRGRECCELIPLASELEGPKSKPIPMTNDARDAENTQPSAYVASIVGRLKQVYHELEVFYGFNPEERGADKSSSRSRGQGSSRSANAVGSSMRMLRMNSEEKYRNREIERMFRERVDVLDTVSSNKSSPMAAILRILAKAYAERLRMQVLTVGECLQVQLDIGCLRHFAPGLTDSDEHGIEFLMEEAITVAGDRTRQELEVSTILKSPLVQKVNAKHFRFPEDDFLLVKKK